MTQFRPDMRSIKIWRRTSSDVFPKFSFESFAAARLFIVLNSVVVMFAYDLATAATGGVTQRSPSAKLKFAYKIRM